MRRAPLSLHPVTSSRPNSAPDLRRFAALQTTFADDLEVLNHALTFEHLESAFHAMSGEWVALVGEYEAAVFLQVAQALEGTREAACQ